MAGIADHHQKPFHHNVRHQSFLQDLRRRRLTPPDQHLQQRPLIPGNNTKRKATATADAAANPFQEVRIVFHNSSAAFSHQEAQKRQQQKPSKLQELSKIYVNNSGHDHGAAAAGGEEMLQQKVRKPMTSVAETDSRRRCGITAAEEAANRHSRSSAESRKQSCIETSEAADDEQQEPAKNQDSAAADDEQQEPAMAMEAKNQDSATAVHVDWEKIDVKLKSSTDMSTYSAAIAAAGVASSSCCAANCRSAACRICGRVFLSGRALGGHMRAHGASKLVMESMGAIDLQQQKFTSNRQAVDDTVQEEEEAEMQEIYSRPLGSDDGGADDDKDDEIIVTVDLTKGTDHGKQELLHHSRRRRMRRVDSAAEERMQYCTNLEDLPIQTLEHKIPHLENDQDETVQLSLVKAVVELPEAGGDGGEDEKFEEEEGNLSSLCYGNRSASEPPKLIHSGDDGDKDLQLLTLRIQQASTRRADVDIDNYSGAHGSHMHHQRSADAGTPAATSVAEAAGGRGGSYELRRNPKPNRRFIKDHGQQRCRLAARPWPAVSTSSIGMVNDTDSSPSSCSLLQRRCSIPSSSSSASVAGSTTPHSCTECGKLFMSWKALFGHMRCHPERQWRGITPPLGIAGGLRRDRQSRSSTGTLTTATAANSNTHRLQRSCESASAADRAAVNVELEELKGIRTSDVQVITRATHEDEKQVLSKVRAKESAQLMITVANGGPIITKRSSATSAVYQGHDIDLQQRQLVCCLLAVPAEAANDRQSSGPLIKKQYLAIDAAAPATTVADQEAMVMSKAARAPAAQEDTDQACLAVEDTAVINVSTIPIPPNAAADKVLTDELMQMTTTMKKKKKRRRDVVSESRTTSSSSSPYVSLIKNIDGAGVAVDNGSTAATDTEMAMTEESNMLCAEADLVAPSLLQLSSSWRSWRTRCKRSKRRRQISEVGAIAISVLHAAPAVAAAIAGQTNMSTRILTTAAPITYGHGTAASAPSTKLNKRNVAGVPDAAPAMAMNHKTTRQRQLRIAPFTSTQSNGKLSSEEALSTRDSSEEEMDIDLLALQDVANSLVFLSAAPAACTSAEASASEHIDPHQKACSAPCIALSAAGGEEKLQQQDGVITLTNPSEGGNKIASPAAVRRRSRTLSCCSNDGLMVAGCGEWSSNREKHCSDSHQQSLQETHRRCNHKQKRNALTSNHRSRIEAITNNLQHQQAKIAHIYSHGSRFTTMRSSATDPQLQQKSDPARERDICSSGDGGGSGRRYDSKQQEADESLNASRSASWVEAAAMNDRNSNRSSTCCETAAIDVDVGSSSANSNSKVALNLPEQKQHQQIKLSYENCSSKRRYGDDDQMIGVSSAGMIPVRDSGEDPHQTHRCRCSNHSSNGSCTITAVEATAAASLMNGTCRTMNRGHECTICHRLFPSGQALGGHKRCHWTGHYNSNVDKVITAANYTMVLDVDRMTMNGAAGAAAAPSASAAAAAPSVGSSNYCRHSNYAKHAENHQHIHGGPDDCKDVVTPTKAHHRSSFDEQLIVDVDVVDVPDMYKIPDDAIVCRSSGASIVPLQLQVGSQQQEQRDVNSKLNNDRSSCSPSSSALRRSSGRSAMVTASSISEVEMIRNGEHEERRDVEGRMNEAAASTATAPARAQRLHQLQFDLNLPPAPNNVDQ